MPKNSNEIVILTGLSGAGKSIAANCLEDIGFYCIDNLPIVLLPQFIDLYKGYHGNLDRFVIVMDIRNVYFVKRALEQLEHLGEIGFKYRLIFLDASDEILVSRFSLTRRQHPLMAEGKTLLECITEERNELAGLKKVSDTIIDTSKTTTDFLQKEIKRLFLADGSSCKINLISFGFKYGVPIEADMMFDVRFLQNPYYEAELKHLTGDDAAVQEYVMKDIYAEQTLSKIYELTKFTIERYKNENKPLLNITVGCTGGHHRSVTVVNKLFELLSADGYKVSASHRDIKK